MHIDITFRIYIQNYISVGVETSICDFIVCELPTADSIWIEFRTKVEYFVKLTNPIVYHNTYRDTI